LNRFAFYGLRRSGNHAILEWLLQNMGGSGNREMVKNRRIMQVNNAAYINEANSYANKEELKRDISNSEKNYEKLTVSYEDAPVDFSLFTEGYKKIVIVRDIENLFASRFKRGQKYKNNINTSDMRIDQFAVDLWKNHINAGLNGDAILIQFEKWVDSKEYRDKLAAQLNTVNYDITDTMTVFGNGSSFSGKIKPTAEELKSRAKMVDLPEAVKNRIAQPDIVELRKKLGYIKDEVVEGNPEHIKVLGDSHIQSFDLYDGNNYNFETVLVNGATARGAINPNTTTNALKIFKKSLSGEKANRIIICLGEVDCGYLIWYKYKFEGLDPIAQMHESLKRLHQFVKTEVEPIYSKDKIILLGSIPPTIKDNTDKRYLAGARSKVDTPLKHRSSLTKLYNQTLKLICELEGWKCIDIIDEVTMEDGIEIKDEYRNPKDNDHHLNPEAHLRLLLNYL